MTEPEVRSPRNARVVAAARLRRARDRRAAGRTLLEGPDVLATAVAAGAVIDVVFALVEDERAARLAARAGAELVTVSEGALARLAPTAHPRGPVAVVPIPGAVPLGERNAVVLWGVADPGNVGTIIRSAAAFGVDAAVTGGGADPWSPKALRAGAGAHYLTRIATLEDDPLAELEAAGLRLLASVVSGGESPARAAGGGTWALLVGEEAQGLPAPVLQRAGTHVTVPMPGGVESLNVAAAAAIVLYELTR